MLNTSFLVTSMFIIFSWFINGVLSYQYKNSRLFIHDQIE